MDGARRARVVSATHPGVVQMQDPESAGPAWCCLEGTLPYRRRQQRPTDGPVGKSQVADAGATVVVYRGCDSPRTQGVVMALTRWRPPGEEISRLERRMRRFLEEPFHFDFFSEEIGWMPAVQVTETEQAIEVAAELPGMTKDDVEISLENNLLAIRGEKKEEKEEKEKERYLYERYFGSFQRVLTLPAQVQESKVSAEFRNGVLKIHLPKAAEAKGRKISIHE